MLKAITDLKFSDTNTLVEGGRVGDVFKTEGQCYRKPIIIQIQLNRLLHHIIDLLKDGAMYFTSNQKNLKRLFLLEILLVNAD